jgi:hypothetical protein
MTVVARMAGIATLGLVLAACGSSGPGGDEGAIQDVFSDFFQAFEDEDIDALAGLLSDDCDDADARAAEAIDDFLDSTLDVDVEFDITGVDIRDLTETTAEAVPQGTSTVDGVEFSLVDSDDPEYASLAKIDGEWKLTDCNILF